MSNYLPAYGETVVDLDYPCFGVTSPGPWTNLAQGALACLDSSVRFPVDLRKAAVIVQHIAWHGAHHRTANQPWGIIAPWYGPAQGSNAPAVKNKGHYLPYNAFARDLYQDPHGSITYAPASTRRDRYLPHGGLYSPGIAPTFQ